MLSLYTKTILKWVANEEKLKKQVLGDNEKSCISTNGD